MKKDGIKFYSEPEFRNPVMLAGWPGIAAVASQAVDYIRRKLSVELFAELDTSEFIVPNSILVSQGVSYFAGFPKIFLFYSKEFDIIICEGEEQFSGQPALTIIERLLYVAQEAGVKKIFTGAALVQHINHRTDPEVYIVANTPGLRDELVKKSGVKLLNQGQISGLNGSILGFASTKNIEAACFLSSVPIYSINLPNPRSSKAIVKIWEELLGFSIDYTDYDLAIEESEHTLDMIEEQLKKMSTGAVLSENPQEEKLPVNYPKSPEDIPSSVFNNIEELFKQAKGDKTFAHKLKEELDRWNLFEQYENRFLDLFKDSQ